MILTYRLILSFLTIAIVFTAATGTTYAYFTSSQSFAGNLISTGSLNFQGTMTDIAGLQEYSIIENNFAPGMTATRCIFIHNSGTLPGRFKIYRGTESGDTTTLGPTLQVTATLSPNSGACSSLTPPGFANLNRYTVTPVTTTIGMTDQSFKSLSATPVKIPKTAVAIQPGQFAVYRLEISLPSTATAAVSSASYTANLEVFGMQAEGSGTDSDW